MQEAVSAKIKPASYTLKQMFAMCTLEKQGIQQWRTAFLQEKNGLCHSQQNTDVFCT